MLLKRLIRKVYGLTKFKLGVLAFVLLATTIGVSLYSTADATGDCNSNSVINCGVSTMGQLESDYDSNTQGIDQIYNSGPFGITSSEFNDFSSNYVMGEVYSNGNVTVNGNLVATDAKTAGRTPQNVNGIAECDGQGKNSAGVYVRKPECSFLSSPLDAFVYMPNGVFKFAVLLSCGNPVTATPKYPAYTITKEVKKAGATSFSKNISVPAGTTVQYFITVTSTGQVAADHILVKDKMDSNIVYTPGTLRSATTDLSSEASQFFGSGITISSLAPGDKVTYSYTAVVGPNKTTATCKAGVLPNTTTISSVGLPSESSEADVSKSCPKTPPSTPTLVCSELTVDKGTPDSKGNTPYKLTATATAQLATIESYTFNLGVSGVSPAVVKTSNGSAVTTYTFPASNSSTPAQYTVTAYVNGKGNNGQKFNNITSVNCAKNVTSGSGPTCTAPNGSVFPQGSQECNTTTTTLVNTGPGDVVGLFAAATGLGAIGHWFFRYRRAYKIDS